VLLGDLGSLDRLTGGSKYYVRIAADSDRNRLVPYLERIERQFKGARSSGLVAIRAPRKGSRLYELVFGQNLLSQRLKYSSGWQCLTVCLHQATWR
jgi:hypothetical protein